MLEAQHFSVQHLSLRPGESFKLRFGGCFGLLYLLQGKLTLRIDGRVMAVSEKEYLLFSDADKGLIFSEGRQDEACVLLLAHIAPDYLTQHDCSEEDLCACFRHPLLPEHRLIDSRHNTNLLVRDLLIRLSRPETELFAVDSYHYSISVMIIVLVSRAFLSRFKAELSRKEQKLSINDIFYYIKDNIHEELSLDRLADDLFFNKYYIAHTFKKQTGIPLHRYILQKKLEYARTLVLQGLPIMEVYKKCGFGDYSNFIRAYKKEYGISPRRHYLSHKKHIEAGRKTS